LLDTIRPHDLGDTFRKQTGLDPSDPRNEKMTIDWGLRYMAQTRDVSPWHGAARVGVTNADVFGDSAATSSASAISDQTKNLTEAGAAWRKYNATIRATNTEQIDNWLKDENRTLDEQRRAIELSTGSWSLNSAAIAAAEEKQHLLNEAQRRTIPVTRELTQRLDELSLKAADNARRDEENARARARYIAELDIGRGAINEGFTGPLKALSRGESPGAAALSALQATQDRFIDMVGGQFSEALLGKIGSTNTGALGSLFGFGGQQNLAQATINAGVVNVNGGVAGAVGGAAGGSGGGLFGWIGSAIGSLFGGGAATNEARVATGFYADGGLVGRSSRVESVPARAFIGAPHFSDGGKVGRPAILHDGEIVLNAMQQRNLADRLVPQAPAIDVSRLMPPMHVAQNYAPAPAQAPNVYVTVEKPPVAARTEETTDANGNRRIRVVFEEAVASAMTSPNGSDAIAAYGGRRRLAKL
jgi:hypothetical protein